VKNHVLPDWKGLTPHSAQKPEAYDSSFGTAAGDVIAIRDGHCE